jgi:hypothetical protein
MKRQPEYFGYLATKVSQSLIHPKKVHRLGNCLLYKKNIKMLMKFAKPKDKMFLMLQDYMLMIFLPKENMKKQLSTSAKHQEILNRFF